MGKGDLQSEAKQLITDTKEFFNDSVMFINKCTKPDKKGN